MTRGLWRKLLSMPPVDWAALAQQHRDQSRRTRKGDKRPIEDVKRQRESYWRNRKARERAAIERYCAKRVAERRKARTQNLTAVMLNAMEPGQWYGRPDIRDLSGAKRNSVHARLALLERAGLVRRARNPDYVPAMYPKGSQIHLQARGRAPEFLFSLTPAGEAERSRLAYLL